MKAHWKYSPSLKRSGFVQCRLLQDDYPWNELAIVEFHAPNYYVEITRNVKGYVEFQHNPPPTFQSLESAMRWATAIVGLS